MKTSSYTRFKNTIQKSVLDYLKDLTKEKKTNLKYLIESGLEKVLKQEVISYDRDLWPKDRIQYKTTYDDELLAYVREFAKRNKLFINDVIEYSV